MKFFILLSSLFLSYNSHANSCIEQVSKAETYFINMDKYLTKLVNSADGQAIPKKLYYLNKLDKITKSSLERLYTLNYGNDFDEQCLEKSDLLYKKIAINLEDIKNYKELIYSVSSQRRKF